MPKHWIMTAVLAGLAPLAAGAEKAPPFGKLPVVCGPYPRVFFFRQAEGWAANQRIEYGRWNATFERLMGIEGKALDEEVPGRGFRNAEFFSRFKKAHPDQLVLLHYNGNARDPRFQRDAFFAGHWIYYNGAKVLADVPAAEGVTEIRVDKPQLFQLSIGRYRDANEDVGLCELDEAGRPDWHKSEQVQLVSIDIQRGVIGVRRGCYGTRPRAFRAGRAYAAAHAAEGPWGRKSHLMWYYNYSTACPRDAKGRTCGQVHAADLAARFAPGGRLAAFDGLEFDVLTHTRSGRGGRRGLDCDADGDADNGFFDGVNAYGAGVIEFVRALRAKMPDKLLLADGHSERHQRAFGIFNGIESEGWPDLRDAEISDWSGGLNRHFFWAATGRAPAFNYINHKFNEPTDKPGVMRTPDLPFSTHRLVFAAGVFTDSAICYAFAPPKAGDELYGVWDELWMGAARRLGWLGNPLGPAVRLATSSEDLLAAQGAPPAKALLQRLSGGEARLALKDGGIEVRPAGEGVKQLRVRLSDVPCDGPDLFVSLALQVDPMKAYPPEMARLVHVGIAPLQSVLVRPDLPEIAMRIRGGQEGPLDRATGASVAFIPNRKLGGQAHNAYQVHPPYRDGRTGYAVWSRDVRIPAGGRLEMHLGMGEKSPARSDGVAFSVELIDLDGDKPAAVRRIFEHTQKAAQWTPHTVSLARWAGKGVRLRFISDCGPKDNATTDHSLWGDVGVVGAAGREALTPAKKFMTWAGAEEFTSGFYFDDVRSETIDLEITIEGVEPARIGRLTAHAHPDAIYREFEKGLVLANPSPRPFEFDMTKLFGGKRFRRIQGSAQQDPQTNDGSPIGAKLRLGPKDALFLVRDERQEK